MSKIQVVWFDELQTWSVALQNTQKIQSKFKLVKLGEVLIDLTKMRTFTIKDDEFYQEPTISSKTNLITARKQGLGREFKVKRRVLILPDDLVIAKMHTQNGLYAFAKETFASTNTFIPFEIVKDKINKDYLFIILKMTLQRLQKFDSVNRETYTTNEILNLQIPLPPLDIQNKIVEDIQNIQAKIKALKEEEQRLKDEIEAYIYIALGLSKQEIGQKHKVFIVNFKDLERWDIRHNQNSPYLVPCDSALCHCEPPHSASAPCEFAPTPCHSVPPLCHSAPTPCHSVFSPCHSERSEESINKTKNKTNNRYFATLNMTANCESASAPCHSERSEESTQKNNRFFANAQNDNATNKPKYPLATIKELCYINPSVEMKELIKQDKNVSFIPMDALSTDGKNFNASLKKASLHKGFTKFQNNDLLWAKITPCMQNKKSAIVDKLENGVGIGSTEFFVLRSKDLNKTNIDFILQFLRTDLVIERAKLNFKGSAGQQRVPKEFLENLKIPLPPLEIQQEIIAFIESKNQKIKNCKESQTTLQEQLNSMLKESLL